MNLLHLECLEPLEHLGGLVFQGVLGHLGRLEGLERQWVLLGLEHLVSLVDPLRLGYPEDLEHLEHLEHLVDPRRLEYPEDLERPEHLEHLVNLVNLLHLGFLGGPGYLEGLEGLGPPLLLGVLEFLEHLEGLVAQDSLGLHRNQLQLLGQGM